MQKIVINSLIVAVPLIVMVAVVILSNLPPRIKPLSPEEMRDTADWLNRLNRRGVERSPKFTPVTGIGRAKEKRVLLLPARQW